MLRQQLNKKLILGRNILTEIFLAQLLEGAVSAQLVDGTVEGVEEGRVFALDNRDRNVRSIFGLGDQLEVCLLYTSPSPRDCS